SRSEMPHQFRGVVLPFININDLRDGGTGGLDLKYDNGVFLPVSVYVEIACRHMRHPDPPFSPPPYLLLIGKVFGDRQRNRLELSVDQCDLTAVRILPASRQRVCMIAKIERGKRRTPAAKA